MDVRLPRLGEGADSGTVAGIFVRVGDQVKKDQPILELESEKAVASIPAPSAGTVTALYVKEGDLIKVGQAILALADEGMARPPAPIDASVGNEEEETPPAPAPSEEKQPVVPSEPVTGDDFPAPAGGSPPASPSLRKMARELGIDLRRVRGSERGGRIVLADVRRYVARLQQAALEPKAGAAAGPPATSALPPGPAIDFGKWGAVERKKLTTLRATISNRMKAAWTTIPHITQFDEADITALLALRKKYAPRYEKQHAHLTLTAFALKAVVPVLKKYPVFAASLDEAASELVYKQYLHIGVAVDTEQGLIVPVIRDVDRKSLFEVAGELEKLAERTRARKVGIEEMQGGSFTISNQGGIGSGHFTPIVNKPEVAILGIGRGVVRPVVRGTKVEQRTMLPLSLSYDHRIIDGADAARFMVDLVQEFENFKEAEVRISS
jgi:pyruvate dehydrogenase E2 component (dihydrolipoamide acetyltransferase)